jgi:hypothetical protein
MLELSDRVRRRPEVTVRTTDKGALLIDLTTGRCWQLNQLGAAFLLQIDAEKRLADVCSVLRDRYDVSQDVLERDLFRLARDLLDAGLIELGSK